MEKKYFGKGIIFGIMLVLLGTSIGTGLQIQTKITNERGSLPITDIIWSENFDNGNISNWTIINPNPGYQPITTLGLSTIQSYSSPYSLLVDSPDENYYSGYALGPMVSVDLTKPYTVEFWFRWNDFHYGYFCCFGHIDAVLDQPFLGINFKDDTGEHVNTGPAFNSYCPVNTWAHFQFNINPATSSFTMIVNGNTILTFNYTLSVPGTSQFGIIDGGAPYSEPDFFDHCYWDDMRIEGTQIPIYITILDPKQYTWNNKAVPILGIAQSMMGTIINVSLVIEGGYERYATINGINWNYVWDSTDVIDGDHTITAYCQDSSGNFARSSPYTIKTDNSGPKIYMLFPINKTLTIYGRPFPIIPVNIIIGSCPLYVHIIDEGVGFVNFNCSFIREFTNIPISVHMTPKIGDNTTWTGWLQGLVYVWIGRCTLKICAWDKKGNEKTSSYSFLKII
jgi:hypothetical protein